MKSFFTILIAFLLFSVTFGQTVSIVQDNCENAGSMYYFHGKKVARTSTGMLVVIWTDLADAGGQINYSVYDSAFDTWSPAAPISAAGDRADKPGIAADDQGGNVHACWQERNTSGENYMIMHSKYDGTAWTTPVVVSLHPDNECEEASIEVDSNGNIWIVYNNDGAGEPNEFVYAVTSTDGGTTWSTSAVALSSSGLIDGSVTNGRCTLVAGPEGKLAVTWHNGLPWDSGRREISFNQYDGTSWSGEVMISDTTSADRVANWYPTVAVDPQANIYVIYHTNNTSADTLDQRFLLVQKKGWDQTWEESVTRTIYIDTDGDMLGTSALCDENGVVHLVFQADVPADTNGLDKNYYTYSKDGGETWSDPLALGREGYDGGYATLSNRIYPDHGIDVAMRESNEPAVNDADLTTVVHVNIPYSYVTDIEEVEEIPSEYDLIRNYPNPFNPTTTIEYTVAHAGKVSLSIYDILGNRIATLVNSDVQAGKYSVKWNGVDNNNLRVASGIYFAALETTLGRSVVKLGLLK